MTKRIPGFFTNRYTLAYAAALLLHLLLLWLYAPLQQVLIGATRQRPPGMEPAPVAFEFVEVPDLSPDKRPPGQTPLRSDRQLAARDRQQDALPPSHLPFSEGVAGAAEELETVQGALKPRDGNGTSEAQQDANAPPAPVLSAADLVPRRANDWLRPLREREEAVYGRPSIPAQSLQLDNRRSSALEKGGLQLSTYAWDFAPYLSYLKRHIESHISPPPAFTWFGLIEGKTRLRFKILRDGSLRDLEVLDYQGSPLLRDTSTGAVDLSSPFRPLPEEFPDAYLEVTGIFNYTVLRDTP